MNKGREIQRINWFGLMGKGEDWRPSSNKVPQGIMIPIEWECQIGVEISDYTGDKISVGVARPSHVLGQSVPCDG